MNYENIMKEHPDLFDNSEATIRIIKDENLILEWQKNKRAELVSAGNPLEWADIGVILNDPYIIVIRDLVEFPGGHIGGYFRLLNRADLSGGQGVVMLCERDHKYLLLHQYRHPIRSWSFEVPRGFGQAGISSAVQAKTELIEEVGGEIEKIVDLGFFYNNSGLEANKIELFYVNLKSIGKPSMEEGIESYQWVSLFELEEMISTGRINDGFTIAAYTRAKLQGLLAS